MERQSQTRINLKEWTIISWVIWGGETPGRPPAELNQGPPTPSLRQDKKERTSHRTAAPTWASSRPRNSRAEGRASYVPSGGPGLVLPFGSTSGQRLNSQIAPFSPCVREIAKYSDIFGSTPALSVPNSASRRDFRRGAAPVAHRASRYGRNTSPHVRNATTTFLRAPLYAPCGTISPLEAPARDAHARGDDSVSS